MKPQFTSPKIKTSIRFRRYWSPVRKAGRQVVVEAISRSRHPSYQTGAFDFFLVVPVFKQSSKLENKLLEVSVLCCKFEVKRAGLKCKQNRSTGGRCRVMRSSPLVV